MTAAYGPVTRTLLLSGATAIGDGSAKADAGNGNVPTFHASMVGTGAISATVLIQGRNVENGGWVTIATLSPSGTTTADAAGVATGRFMEWRASVTAFSGTATLNVAMAS